MSGTGINHHSVWKHGFPANDNGDIKDSAEHDTVPKTNAHTFTI